jgi:REP element-mobilizing transposase RayT
MADKYQNKYRIASARAPWWNYGWSGAYFITICTANRHHFFGEIKDSKMQLSGLGILADIFWYEIKNHAKNVELGAFVVMPNHIHGILILNNPQNFDGIGGDIDDGNGNGNDENGDDGDGDDVETRHALSLQSPQSPQSRFQNQGKNTISSIIGSYKSAVTKHANRLGLLNNDLEFGWQTRFHDHIVRDDAEYQRINDYIENNPKNWDKDKFFLNEE